VDYVDRPGEDEREGGNRRQQNRSYRKSEGSQLRMGHAGETLWNALAEAIEPPKLPIAPLQIAG